MFRQFVHVLCSLYMLSPIVILETGLTTSVKPKGCQADCFVDNGCVGVSFRDDMIFSSLQLR